MVRFPNITIVAGHFFLISDSCTFHLLTRIINCTIPLLLISTKFSKAVKLALSLTEEITFENHNCGPGCYLVNCNSSQRKKFYHHYLEKWYRKLYRQVWLTPLHKNIRSLSMPYMLLISLQCLIII